MYKIIRKKIIDISITHWANLKTTIQQKPLKQGVYEKTQRNVLYVINTPIHRGGSEMSPWNTNGFNRFLS